MSVLAPLVASLIFAGVGGALCWAAAASIRRYRSILSSSYQAEGVVVAMGVDNAVSSETSFSYPIVEFEDRTGRRITFESSRRVDPPAHRVGDRVPVYYNPAEPQRADIRGSDERNAFLLLLLGLPFLLAGVGMFVQCVLLQSCGEVR